MQNTGGAFMKTIAVTGSSGKLGSKVVEKLISEGYEIIGLDERRSDMLSITQFQVDLTNMGEVVGALKGADAIIHLAAIPSPRNYTNDRVFSNNVLSTYYILEAASLLNISKVILASSESSYGFAWAPQPFEPLYFPVDEEHPQLPQESYGLSKIVNEETAAMFQRRTGIQVIGMRFSMIVTPEEYRKREEAIRDPELHKNILWSYIDIRDAVNACLAGIRTPVNEYVSVNITSSDTFSDWSTDQLLSKFYPEVERRREKFHEREALVSNELACRILNWRPEHSWVDR